MTKWDFAEPDRPVCSGNDAVLPDPRCDREWRRKLVSVASAGAVTVIAVGLILFLAPPFPEAIDYRQITHDGQRKQGPLMVDGSRIYFGEITNSRYVARRRAGSRTVQKKDARHRRAPEAMDGP